MHLLWFLCYKGGAAIARALAGNVALVSVNLHGICLGPEGGKAIARALMTNRQ